jgi:bisphosphoglycerate-dependent phosphoglycerate mutase
MTRTRVFLVRHGETLWNQEQRCQGFSDVALSEKGIEQAERLGRYLAKLIYLSAVYSSDLIRAKKPRRSSLRSSYSQFRPIPGSGSLIRESLRAKIL